MQQQSVAAVDTERTPPLDHGVIGNGRVPADILVRLIHAAMTIGELIEARDGKVGAWA
jgi:hypothetical protein